MIVKFFGPFGERMGNTHNIDVPDTVSIKDIIYRLAADDDEFAADLEHKSTSYILNNQVVPVETMVSDRDELAFLPPVSGG